jgi:hypothetical protein
LLHRKVKSEFCDNVTSLFFHSTRSLNFHHEIRACSPINSGADVEARNSTNDTPMSLARLGQHDGLGIFLADAILQVEKARKQQAAAAAGGASAGSASAAAASSSSSSDMADGDDENEDGDAALVETEEELTGGGQVADELAPEQPSQSAAPSQP